MRMSILFSLLLMQAGPLVSPGTAPPIRSDPLEMRQPKPEAAPPPPTRLQECLTLAGHDPLAAIEVAEAWLQTVKGSPQTDPQHCIGIAYNYLGRWSDAEPAFLAARDAAAPNERGRKASLGAMAAFAALDQQAFARADAAFLAAHTDALAAGRSALAGDISIDRSRALVALNRMGEAETALDEGRTTSPANPAGWLLSATLSRRQGRLAQAQSQIERAAQLMPIDPQIGLEAGVIAVLSGREASARKSWQSVLDVSPDSDEAKTAKAYLDQLSAAPTPAGK
jgi:tetratricopeptide (TPR) repeat protein